MVNKIKFPFSTVKKLIFLLLITLLSSLVFAQETEEEEIAPVETKWQTLEWDEEFPEYVTYYEIYIEKFNQKTEEYESLQTVRTEGNETSISVNPQLAPGAYRYKIITYDLLEFPGAESEWVKFVIYQAYQPEIKDISSNVNLSSTIYLEEYNDGIFTISGKNLFEEPVTDTQLSYTKYYLQKENKKNDSSVTPEIISHDSDNKKIKLQFQQEQLNVGEYNFIAIDASGLQSTADGNSHITIKFKKLMDLNVSAGYTLPLVLYDNTLPDHFKTKIWPISANAKVTFIPFKQRWGYLGIGAEATYSRMSANFNSYKVSGNFITGHANLVYQKPIYRKISDTKRKHILTLEVHGGAGIVYMMDYKFFFAHDIVTPPLNSINISVDAGVALQYYITSRLYTEAEVNYINAFMADMSLGMVVPSISVGWQF